MTASADTVGVCLVGQITTADTRAIESGLNELWRLAEAGEVGGAVVRAASMTFLVPVGDEAGAARMTDLLDALTATHPFRAILLLADDRLAEPRARLSSHLRRGGEGEGAWYWEEIQLVSPRRSLHQVMSSVATLALPNLPLQTWWPGQPAFDDDLYNQVAEVSDRVLVDSSGFVDPTAGLGQLAAVITAAHESIAFADLSWTRLTPWRMLTAELFDRPSDQALLDSIEQVRVEYLPSSDEGGEAAQALLLVGWLASRLGWEPRRHSMDERGTGRIEVVDGVRSVEIQIGRRAITGATGSPAAGSGEVPGLCAVSIATREGPRTAWYGIERWGDGEEARTIAESDGSRSESHAHLPDRDEADLLSEELGGFATDRVYQEALAFLARVVRA